MCKRVLVEGATIQVEVNGPYKPMGDVCDANSFIFVKNQTKGTDNPVVRYLTVTRLDKAGAFSFFISYSKNDFIIYLFLTEIIQLFASIFQSNEAAVADANSSFKWQKQYPIN